MNTKMQCEKYKKKTLNKNHIKLQIGDEIEIRVQLSLRRTSIIGSILCLMGGQKAIGMFKVHPA